MTLSPCTQYQTKPIDNQFLCNGISHLNHKINTKYGFVKSINKTCVQQLLILFLFSVCWWFMLFIPHNTSSLRPYSCAVYFVHVFFRSLVVVIECIVYWRWNEFISWKKDFNALQDGEPIIGDRYHKWIYHILFLALFHIFIHTHTHDIGFRLQRDISDCALFIFAYTKLDRSGAQRHKFSFYLCVFVYMDSKS